MMRRSSQFIGHRITRGVIPAISQPSAAISLHKSRLISRYIQAETFVREISDIMAAPKTLLELSGADLKPPRLAGAVLVLIDLQNEYVAGPLALPDANSAIASASRLLARARKNGTPIFHIAHK